MPIRSIATRFASWFDQWGLFCLVVLLLAFIPVYPKLPLFDILPGYIVRVRLEDMLIAGTVLVWLIQLLRKKIAYQTPVTRFIAWYAGAGIAALLSGIFFVQSIPIETLHISKSVLHYLRYLEYFALFFLAVSVSDTRKKVNILVITLLLALGVVGAYGIGQKYWFWPVYSTMNREFSKGVRLYLTEHARVQSTFGGHYDLAAYLVILLPIVLSLSLTSKNRTHTVLLWLLFILGVWLITVSASRTSFAAFALSALLVPGLLSLKESTWRLRTGYFLRHATAVITIILVFFLSFGADIRERLVQTLAAYPVVHTPYLQASNFAMQLYQQTVALVPWTLRPSDPPENSLSTTDLEAMVASDQQPTPVKPGETQRPVDVYTDVPDKFLQATSSATGEVTYVVVEKPRTYSEAALKHGLSLAIRLDTLWPQAIAGFKSNPLFGSGYATLTKSTVYQFTEAESTDNNFLRTLGETGIVGFITFYGAVITSAILAWQLAWQKLQQGKLHTSTALGIGFVVATIGLLLNAMYIDVFASSKVALIYWAIAGIIARMWLQEKKHSLPPRQTKSKA